MAGEARRRALHLLARPCLGLPLNTATTSSSGILASSPWIAGQTSTTTPTPHASCWRHGRGLPPLAPHLPFRTFASGTTASRLATTDAVLQQVQVKKLRDELDDEAQQSVYITYKDFVQRAKASGAAQTDDDADALCAAMQKSGLVLRHGHLVYLSADEIADMVMMMLPGGRDEAASNLRAVEAELEEMDKVHSAVEVSAHRTTNVLMVGGAVVLFAQLIGFIYLTWWELSWDVMEPFGYIIQLFYSFLAYIYFLSTKGNVFDLGPFREFWNHHFRKKKIAAAQFDEERYAHLQRLRGRYLRHMSHAALRL